MTSLLLLKSMLVANALSKSKKKKKKLLLKSKQKAKLGADEDICRICDDEQGDIPIFNNFVHPNLPKEIHNFSGVMMEKSDDLRKYMCQNCLDLLNGCILFRDMCQKTNKKLIEMAIKKEVTMEPINDYNGTEYHDIDQQAESDCSYNIPSPNYSEESTEVHCTYCDRVFPDSASYRAHRTQCHKNKQSTPTPKKKFLCDVCGKISKSSASLLAHKTIHENVFPYKCEICPYQGRTLDLLKVHKRSHLTEAERPYRCPHCPKATTSASNLSKHVRHVHSANKAFKCTYCERAFSFHHDMKRHIREIHLRQGTVECDICFKKFNTKKILRGHQYKIHKLKGERQGRLPAYLQAQVGVPTDNGENNINDNEPEYLPT